MTDDIALYFHFPFCRKRCGYCSFVSFAERESDIPRYIDALEYELIRRCRAQSVTSIFLGGGTPSLLSPEQLGRILATTRMLFDVQETVEITLEANPGTVDEPYLASVRGLGINRLSLGVQSFDDGMLAVLGRIHSAAQARQALLSARTCGFADLSLDLIYGIPGQSLAGWKDTLREAVDLGPGHLSLYPLTLDEDAPLSRAVGNGELPAIDADRAAEAYEAAEEYLAAEGYRHYEISNWARQGAESRHNMVYWRCMPYLGFGVGAHSHIDGHRRANTRDLDQYLRAFELREPCEPEMVEEITPELEVCEAIVMGLRLSQGVSFAGMRERFGVDLNDRYGGATDELAGLGLVEVDGSGFRLTPRGRLLGNEVFWRFLPD